jgi:hypothetical protein
LINELKDPRMQARWANLAESGWEGTQWAFENFRRTAGRGRNVLNCAIPPARAYKLVEFTFPPGWSLHNCLVAGIGFGAEIPDGLEEWAYAPKIRAVRQLPQLRQLPAEHALLMRSPWLQSPSQARGLGINARHLRYHHQLWQELQPETLRGVFTSLVYVTPQLSLSLAPHIDLHGMFSVYATLDPKLKAALKMDRDAFADAYCLDRGVITHDGLPCFLPVEMQASVFAVILIAWELEMDRPGDLTSSACGPGTPPSAGTTSTSGRSPISPISCG